MLTATGYIAAANWSSGNLLYTNPSGMRSKIIDINPQPYSTTGFNIELIEAYPTGFPTNINYTDTRTIVQLRSDNEIANGDYKCDSYAGSQVRVKASGEMFISVNYILLDQEISRWPGVNCGLENGKLY